MALAAEPPPATPLAASRFPELRRFLEEHLFDRRRKIKRESCQRRFGELLAQAEQRLSEMLERADRALSRAQELERLVRGRLARPLLDRERRLLLQELDAAYRRGAAEVLDFVRPRRWAFGEHRASRADLDFLIDLLLDELSRMGSASAERMSRELRGVGEELGAGLAGLLEAEELAPLRPRVEALAQLVAERTALLREQVYTRHHAFARGFLRGGRVQHFFEEELPHLDLTEEAIHEALLKSRVDLEEELLGPLSSWLEEAAAGLGEQLARLRLELELHELELEHRLLRPLAALGREARLVERSTVDRPSTRPE